MQVLQDARFSDKQLHREPGRLWLLFPHRFAVPHHHSSPSSVDLWLRLLQTPVPHHHGSSSSVDLWLRLLQTPVPHHHGSSSSVDLWLRLLQTLLHFHVTQLVHFGASVKNPSHFIYAPHSSRKKNHVNSACSHFVKFCGSQRQSS